MWQININRRINLPIATVTSFNNEHNHEISIETVKFTTAYKNFPDEIMEQIEFYVDKYKPYDKAGAYAIQGIASRWIPRIEGDYSNVVGLPVALVWKMLRKQGLV